jgi:ribosome maturation factor RimP
LPVDVSQIEILAKPVAARHGCELVDASFRREGGGWVLRLYIDRPGVTGIGVDLCAEVSRDLSAELDVADIIDHPYTLEVSSPGLDRPLKTAQDFRRYVGRAARVKTREAIAGQRNFPGRIAAVADDGSTVSIVADDGNTHVIPLAVIAKANLKIEI